MAKDKPTLADHVEASERRAAPRAQARVAARESNGGPLWAIIGVLAVAVLTGGFFWLRSKGLI